MRKTLLSLAALAALGLAAAPAMASEHGMRDGASKSMGEQKSRHGKEMSEARRGHGKMEKEDRKERKERKDFNHG